MAVKISEHDNKFDRQMRLWGAHGQKNIEQAQVCVLGSGPTATESLKNLVLPNVGQFTVIDDQKVTIADCGNNFFVTQDDIGKSRAEVVKNLLLEMNSDVIGHSLFQNPGEIINNNIGFFDKFNLVIATQLYGENHYKLAKHLYQKNIPYLSARSNGLIGYVRAQYPEIAIIESHPTNDRTDLYIYPKQLQNFKELQNYINSYDIDVEDLEKHAHLPCIAILGQYTQRWITKHGSLPKSFQEQQEFKSKLSELGTDENFEEAAQWAYQCYLEPRIDRDVRDVLNDKCGEKLNEHSSNFWVLVRALKDFMEHEGAGFLPISTNIPDIMTDTKSYVILKNIYKMRYEHDRNLIKKYVEQRLHEIKRDVKSISDELIDRFVKNCRSLKVVRTRSMDEEYNNPDLEHIGEKYMDLSLLEEGKDSNDKGPFNPKNINWYWAFRSIDEFWNHHKRVPGSIEDKEIIDNDGEGLIKIQQNLFKKMDLEQEVIPECLKEMCRFGGEEIHNTAAMIGGVVAQASMKILLEQFYEFNHTFIWNGIFCSADVITV